MRVLVTWGQNITHGFYNNGFTGSLGERDFSERLGLKVLLECPRKGLNGQEEEVILRSFELSASGNWDPS